MSQEFPPLYKAAEQSTAWPYRMLFTSGCLWLLAMVMFLYSGAGHSINTWINKYMGDVVKLPVFFASGTISVYNLGLAAGRFVCSMVVEKVGYYKVIFLSTMGGLASITLALFSPLIVLTVISLGLTGFFFGSLFPTAIAIGGSMYPGQKGFITGMLVTMAALGSMTIPAVTGLISQVVGLEQGMKSLVVWGIILLVVGTCMFRFEDKKERNQAFSGKC
jgi:fucose permease